MKPFDSSEIELLRQLIREDATVVSTCVKLGRPMHEVLWQADQILEEELGWVLSTVSLPAAVTYGVRTLH